MSWPDRPVIFYDDTCGFCNRSVQWILKRGGARRFYFAPLQGSTFQKLVANKTKTRLPDSLIFWQEGKLLSQSGALVAIVRRLPWPWKIGVLTALIPACVRDWLYEQLAKRRHSLMQAGRQCMSLNVAEQTAFLP
jgi:predicted DCC family thiol-disulfide oxidoreductase YuxK